MGSEVMNINPADLRVRWLIANNCGRSWVTTVIQSLVPNRIGYGSLYTRK